jgi:uroporphyrinogen-III synthase
MSDAALALKELRKTFHQGRSDLHVLNGADLAVAVGEQTARELRERVGDPQAGQRDADGRFRRVEGHENEGDDGTHEQPRPHQREVSASGDQQRNVSVFDVEQCHSGLPSAGR